MGGVYIELPQEWAKWSFDVRDIHDNTLVAKVTDLDLVRCGECIHHDEDGWGYGNCQRPSVDYLRTADEDFCSYGERREE